MKMKNDATINNWSENFLVLLNYSQIIIFKIQFKLLPVPISDTTAFSYRH